MLEVIEEEPRALARRMVLAGTGVDAVLVEDWGASLPGTQTHTQEPLLTVEAFADYLELARPAGLVSVSRQLLLPPANAPRLAAVAVQALAAAGATDAAAHLAMIRNWDSFTLLVGARPLTARQIGELRSYAAGHGFDLVALPGLDPAETNRFNRLAEPFHAQAVAAVLAGRNGAGVSASATGESLVDLRPPTDDRPFFNRFVRWSRLADYQRATGDRLYGLLLSGDVVALAVLAEALLLAVALVAIPVARTRLRRERSTPHRAQVAAPDRAQAAAPDRAQAAAPHRERSAPQRKRSASRREQYALQRKQSAPHRERSAPHWESSAPRRQPAADRTPLPVIVSYNLALGLGFILIELMLIQRLTIAFGDPVVSLKVVLAALLVWSAAGGLLSERLAPRRATLALAAIVGVVLAYTAAGTQLLPWLLGLTRPARIGAVVLLLGPLGVALGVAFPLGMRLLAPTAAARSLAWAANGAASVVGAVASTLLAVAQGITALGLLATVAYVAAAVSIALTTGGAPRVTTGDRYSTT